MAPFERGKTAESDLEAFNARWQNVSSGLRFTVAKGRYVLSHPSENSLETIHSTVVRSFADLLLSSKLELIRHCGGCGWVFYDTSRNHLRRWCLMNICGNRAKARRHYEKVRKARSRASIPSGRS